MSGEKHKHASPDTGTDRDYQPKRKTARYEESYPIAGPSTRIPNTMRPPLISLQQPRPLLPKPIPAPSEANFPVHVATLKAPTRVVDSRIQQVPQTPVEQFPYAMSNQSTNEASQSILLQGSIVIPSADTGGLTNIQTSPSFSVTQDVEFQPVSMPVSNADTALGNQATSPDLLSQISLHTPTPWGYCFFCDDLWRNHRESMMGLFRAQGGVGIIDCGMDSTPIALTVFRSYLAFQDHIARYHGWSLGG